jgi:hypothetical protein
MLLLLTAGTIPFAAGYLGRHLPILVKFAQTGLIGHIVAGLEIAEQEVVVLGTCVHMIAAVDIAEQEVVVLGMGVHMIAAVDIDEYKAAALELEFHMAK